MLNFKNKKQVNIKGSISWDGVEFVAPNGTEAVEGLEEVSALLKLLSSKVVLKIISVLSTGELSPRQIAEATGVDESIVSRKLKRLKEHRLVEYSWVRSGDRNLKVYRLSKRALTLVASYPSPKILLKDPGKGREECGGRIDKALTLSYDAPPPRLMTFVGREEDLKTLHDNWPGTVIITGVSGVGKTSLVTEYVHRYGLADKVMWYEFTGLEDYYSFLRHVASALERRGYVALIDALRRGERDNDLLARLLAEGMDKTGTILVLDDYHKCGDGKVKLLLPVIAVRISASQLIVISRVTPQELLTLSRPPESIELRGLKFHEVKDLLQSYNVAVDNKVTVEVHVATQGIPALVEAFATLVRNRGLEEALNALRSGAIASAFWMRIYSSLTPAERRALRVLAHFDEALPPELIAEMAGMRGAVRALYTLVDKGMAEEVGLGFRLKDWVRSVMKLRHINPAYYIKVGDTYLKSSDNVELFIKALRYYVKAGDEGRCLAALRHRLLRIKYRLLEILESYRNVLLEIDRFAKNPELLGYLNLELGMVLVNLGKLKEGLERLKRAARIGELLRNNFLLSYANSVISSVLVDLGDAKESLKRALQALDKALRVEDSELRPHALHSAYSNLTKVYVFREELDKAYEYVLKEVEVAGMLNDPIQHMLSLSHVAIVKGLMGKLEESIVMLKQIRRDLKLLKVRGLATQLGYALIVGLTDVGRIEEVAQTGSEVLAEMLELGRMFFYCNAIPLVTYAFYAAGKEEDANQLTESARLLCVEYKGALCALDTVITYFKQGQDKAREVLIRCSKELYPEATSKERIRNMIESFEALKYVIQQEN